VSDVVAEFVSRINAHDVAGLTALMTEDHQFIDSLGNRVRGREAMCGGWAGYLSVFPDYRLELDETYRLGDVTVMFGRASGSFQGSGTVEDSFLAHICARATVRDGLVASWRIYADNKPVYEVLKRHGVSW
jgi:ketosteroid isomerase-like protein